VRLHVIDLDGSVTAQQRLLRACRPRVFDLAHWGPRLRIACRWGRFARFERSLLRRLPAAEQSGPVLTFLGSGDFHHVTLALLRRLRRPFNLLVIDKHPDWVRGAPVLHCGTWLAHAARLPQVRQIFHVGGEIDFDNAWRWLAPAGLVRSGKIAVFPACRTLRKGFWRDLPNEPVRPDGAAGVSAERLEYLLRPFCETLERWPLYISLDKDVLVAGQAPVNWDSGVLGLDDVRQVVSWFSHAARHALCGMDVVGDWSQVCTRGWLRALLHWVEHPALEMEADVATRRNQALNLALASLLALEQQPVAGSVPWAAARAGRKAA
jgi:hypothetical protein